MTLRRAVRIFLGILAVIVALVLGFMMYVVLAWDSPSDRRLPVMAVSHEPSAVARGEFLFKYGLGCWECHSSVADPNSPPSGGKPFDLRKIGPGFGMFYTPNITPDSATGIGGWTDGEIVRAVREGVSKNGRKLFPLMPVANFHGMSDDDALAIVAYLRSIPPVSNAIPEHDLTFVTKAFFTVGILKPAPEIATPIITPPRGVTPEWGKYVSSNAGLCSDCHSVRNLMDGSFYPDSGFAGSSINFGEAEGDGIWTYASNLTPDKETGIGAWTENDFLQAVQYGVRPDGRTLVPHMPYPLFAFWDSMDVKAVYAYLKTLPAIPRPEAAHTYSQAITTGSGAARGKDIYGSACLRCHGAEGKGTGFTNVKLAEVAGNLNEQELLTFIRGGNLGLRMPPFEKTFSEDQLKDVIAFIRTWETKQ